MNKQLSPWIDLDGAATRVIKGTDPSNIANRVALIEKTPRVRIRDFHHGTYSSGERQWEEWLNWCEGYKGSGPDDEDSRAWCDRMLLALGYTL